MRERDILESYERSCSNSILKMEKLDNISVIIRSVNERTEHLCKVIAERQVSPVNVFLIHETPFSKAVRKGFEIGIDSGKDWTLTLDADVLLKENAIIDLVTFAEGLDENYFEVQGNILDKIFCIPRNGGPHLFRTKYLKKAITFIPAEGSSLRPESTVFKRMLHEGYHYYNNMEIYGIHDYFQYYKDIYRKCFLQAHKHRRFLSYFHNIWNEKSQNDFDYQVALWGLNSGKIFTDTVFVDANFLKEETEQVFNLKHVKEKDIIDAVKAKQIDESFVKKEIESYHLNTLQKSIVNDFYREIDSRTINVNHVRKKKWHNKVFGYSAAFFEKLGGYLKQYA